MIDSFDPLIEPDTILGRMRAWVRIRSDGLPEKEPASASFNVSKADKKLIEKAHELGFPAVEFWPWRSKDLDHIAEIVAETGIEIAQFTAWGFNPGMNNPKQKEL